MAGSLSAEKDSKEDSLEHWYTKALLGEDGKPGFYPNTTGWEKPFAATFARDAKMSVGLMPVDYDGLFASYQTAQQAISVAYSSFTFEFTSLVVFPNQNDTGGIVVGAAIDIGILRDGSGTTKVTDGSFAVVSEVKGKRLITEWREVSKGLEGLGAAESGNSVQHSTDEL